MCVGNLHKHENSKNSEVTLGIYFGQREKWGGGLAIIIDFRNENGQFTGS